MTEEPNENNIIEGVINKISPEIKRESREAEDRLGNLLQNEQSRLAMIAKQHLGNSHAHAKSPEQIQIERREALRNLVLDAMDNMEKLVEWGNDVLATTIENNNTNSDEVSDAINSISYALEGVGMMVKYFKLLGINNRSTSIYNKDGHLFDDRFIEQFLKHVAGKV